MNFEIETISRTGWAVDPILGCGFKTTGACTNDSWEFSASLDLTFLIIR
jgi:hypothetical protein